MKQPIRFYGLLVLGLLIASVGAHAALFEDTDARLAVLDLRKQIEVLKQTIDKQRTETAAQAEEGEQVRRSVLDLQSQIESLKAELAQIKGDREVMLKELSNIQRLIKDQNQAQADRLQLLQDQLRKFEPQKVSMDGIEFQVEPAEKRDFDEALDLFRKGDFANSASALSDLLKRYPRTGYQVQAFFWMGNAQYAVRDYKNAIANFKSLIAAAPQHPRASESMLAIANCQIELKDTKSARKTLEDLLRDYPQTEAAAIAKDRLARIK